MGNAVIGIFCFMAAIFIFFAIMIPMVNIAVLINARNYKGSWVVMIFCWTIGVWGALLGASGAVWFLKFIESLLK